MIANLPVAVIVRVVPFAIVNGPVTDALLAAAIVTLPVVAAKFTRNRLSLPLALPFTEPSFAI